MSVLVGIPLALDDRGRWRAGREYHYLDSAYARAVARAGALPVLLGGEAQPAALVERLDALLIPGGDDFAPPRPYPPGVEFELVPAPQLAFDRALVDAALARALPTLGICYGMQLLALALGGALDYDLATDRPGATEHRLREPSARHAISVEPGSALAEIVGAGPLAVNSRHHQAVSAVGPALRVAARADDGVIEALERPGARFCLGVQWHPEALDDPASRALFSRFVAAAGEARKAR